MEKKERKTSWGNVAPWYDKMFASENSYQKDLILPKLLGLMQIQKGETILDLACGQGFFTNEFKNAGAEVIGADISPELVQIAQKNFPKVNFLVSAADKLSEIKNNSFDKITIILALQNISNLYGIITECFRVLKPSGKLFIVLNHPAFRVPQKSDWGYDAAKKVQYRRVEKYLSESMIKIDMTPGEKNIKKKVYTTSYHRALSTYFSIFHKTGFLVAHFEEWASHKTSQAGPKQKIEDTARKEIPLFACIEAVRK